MVLDFTRNRIFDEFLNLSAHRYVYEILNRMVSELMLSFAHMKSRFSHPAYQGDIQKKVENYSVPPVQNIISLSNNNSSMLIALFRDTILVFFCDTAISLLFGTLSVTLTLKSVNTYDNFQFLQCVFCYFLFYPPSNGVLQKTIS